MENGRLIGILWTKSYRGQFDEAVSERATELHLPATVQSMRRVLSLRLSIGRSRPAVLPMTLLLSISTGISPRQPLQSRSGKRRGTSPALRLKRRFLPFAMCRDLEDAIMELRVNEKEIGTWIFKSEGDSAFVEAADDALLANADHWLVREITLFMKRTLKRVDVSSRSIITLVEPGSCFTGTLLELVFAADRSFMLDGTFESSNVPEASIVLTDMNFGPLTMPNGLTRLDHRFLTIRRMSIP